VKLDLSQSSINDTSILKLAALSTLRSLNLNGTSVTEKGLMALAHLKSLQSIYLFQSNVNAQAWEQLKNTFPNTIIDTGNYLVPMFPADTTEYTYEQLAKDKNAKSTVEIRFVTPIALFFKLATHFK
jgi:hypothetical protein